MHYYFQALEESEKQRTITKQQGKWKRSQLDRKADLLWVHTVPKTLWE